MLDPRKILADNVGLLLDDPTQPFSRAELAKRSGIGRRTLGHLEAGDAWPQLDTMWSLAQAFRVQPWQLLAPNLGREIVAPASGDVPQGFVRLTRLDVTFSAGPGAEGNQVPDVVEHLDVREEWLRALLGTGRPERLHIVNVRGDSMSSTINSGDIAFVDPTVTHFDADGIYVLVWHNRALIKRLRMQVDGRLAIQSDHPDRNAYPIEYVSGDEADRLHIQGKVVGWWTLKRS